MSTRYFLMRCADARLLERAHFKSMWPVSFGVVDKLNEAFSQGAPLIMIFTVTGSGAFQGAARMRSAADTKGAAAWGGGTMPACHVEWIKRADLPYSEAEHLINPLSDPPQPVRAGRDGTEIDAAVAEELLGLLEKAVTLPKPSPKRDGTDAAPADQPTSRLAGQPPPPAGGMRPPGLPPNVGGVPQLVGGGLMGMPDASSLMMGMNLQGMNLQGMNPLLAQQAMALGMMNPMLAAGMMNMNPMAAAMMMGGMPGMMSGLRPHMGAGALAAPGAAVMAPAAAGGDGGKGGAPPSPKPEPRGGGGTGPGDSMGGRERSEPPYPQDRLRDGPPPGFGGGPPGGPGGRYGGAMQDERYDREWERYDARYDGPPRFRDGGPPFREGPPYGPPPFRAGPPPRDFDRFPDRGPPYGRGYGDFRGPPPGRDFPPRDRSPPPPRREDRPDVLRMSYEEYVDAFNKLKQMQNGSGGGMGGEEATAAPADSKAEGGAAAAAAEGASGPSASLGPGSSEPSGPAGEGSAGAQGREDASQSAAAGPANLSSMSEDDYVAYCRQFSAQVGMPFNEDMVRSHYRTTRTAVAAQMATG